MVKVSGYLGEIRIRTTLQDRWAQIVEALDSTIIESVAGRAGRK
jgi:ppGpp synthetase/RelA/SpoT-type nucleotidyltranferase